MQGLFLLKQDIKTPIQKKPPGTFLAVFLSPDLW
jgi:hypothetical protein